MNKLTLALALYAAFSAGIVVGVGLMCCMQAAKRRVRLTTARHLRRNDYGNRWSQPYPVSDPMERSGRIGGKVERLAPWPEPPENATYENTGRQIGSLVDEKNHAYGDSFLKSESVIKTLYPHGVRVDQYGDLLAIVRVVDKMFRIATKKDAFGESPWQDIAGYGILKTRQSQHENEAML